MSRDRLRRIRPGNRHSNPVTITNAHRIQQPVRRCDVSLPPTAQRLSNPTICYVCENKKRHRRNFPLAMIGIECAKYRGEG